MWTALTFGVLVGLAVDAAVPGIGGSQLEGIHDYKLHSPVYCENMSSWTTVWLRVEDMVPFRFSHCLVPDLSLHFNVSTGEYHSRPGVRVRPRHFGQTDPVEYLDPGHVFKHISKYYAPFADFLVNKLGYERGRTLFGAPYDWRVSPWHMTFNQEFKLLVELASSLNGNSPVVIIGHSMGGPVLQNFFSHTPQAWKDKFIRAQFLLEGAFLGAPKIVKALVSGESFHIPVDSHALSKAQRSMESFVFLLPDRKNWPKDAQTLLITPQRNYTVFDYKDLLKDLNLSHPAERLKWVDKGWAEVTVPRVPTYCVYGYGTKTPSGYVYESLNAMKPLLTMWTDGDGTVPLHSLTACKNWQLEQTQPVHMKGFKNVQHVQAIQDPQIFSYFQEVLSTL